MWPSTMSGKCLAILLSSPNQLNNKRMFIGSFGHMLNLNIITVNDATNFKGLDSKFSHHNNILKWL